MTGPDGRWTGGDSRAAPRACGAPTLLINGCAVAVERRRHGAVLWAMGVRGRKLYATQLLQTTLATAAGVALASTSAIVGGGLYLRMMQGPDIRLTGPLYGFDFTGLAAFTAGGLAAAIVAGLATLPLTAASLGCDHFEPSSDRIRLDPRGEPPAR